MKVNISRCAAQAGVSLVESLVALVVLSVGLLGIASLYVTSLQADRSALTRTQAVNIVNDMADRIRANVRAREAYKLSDYEPDELTETEPPECLETMSCSPSELARHDIISWLGSFKQVLPDNATADITYQSTGSGMLDRYRITVSWIEASEIRTEGRLPTLNYSVVLDLMPVTP